MGADKKRSHSDESDWCEGEAKEARQRTEWREDVTNRNLVMNQILEMREGNAHVSGFGQQGDSQCLSLTLRTWVGSGLRGQIIVAMVSGIASHLPRLISMPSSPPV